jgi:(R,R)-butanediol dehydrogenase / meso-butanediol dehydrogenase / diacetyl reductase
VNATMPAAVFYGQHDVRIEQVPIPTPGPLDVVLQVTAVGVCGTDAHEYHSGPHQFPITHTHPASGHQGPMVMGHEFAGRVVARGVGVSGFEIGELVACAAGVSCGDCVNCHRGRTNLCESYWTVGLNGHGGLAEYVRAPAAICFSADAWGLSEHLAALAQPMAIAVHATTRGRVAPHDDVVIIGAGGIGAFLVRAGSEVSNRVAVIDLDQERLDLASANGALWTLQAGTGVDPQAAKTQWGLRPTVVFEVTGTEAGLAAARQWLEPGARLVLVGLHNGDMALDYRTTSLIEHELIGTNGLVAATDLPKALELLASGKGAFSQIAPDVVPLSQVVQQGLAPLAEGRATRVLHQRRRMCRRLSLRRKSNYDATPLA